MIFVLFADDAIFYFCDLQCRTEYWTLLFLAHMLMYIFFFFFHRRSRHAGVLRFTSGPRDRASTTRTRLSPSWTRSPTLAAISRHCYLFSRCAWSFAWCFLCAFAKLSDGPENSEYSEKSAGGEKVSKHGAAKDSGYDMERGEKDVKCTLINI